MTKETKIPTAPLSETLIPKIGDATKEQCIEDLRALAIANPELCISRNYYRVNGKYTESCYSKWAGTFAEFKRQAGIVLSRQQHQLEKHIAKHASVDHYRKLNIERQDYADKYLRGKDGRFKTIITASDLHDIEIDPFFLRVFLDTIARVQPDVIVFDGDIFDLPEFGKYGVDPREWDVVGRIRFVHENIFKPIREMMPDVQIDFIEGNHESVEENTDILCNGAWVKAKDITYLNQVASYKIDSGEISYASPIAIKRTANQPLISVKSASQDELLYERHKIDYKGELQYVDKFVGESLSRSGFRHFGNANNVGIDLTDNEIRLATWVVMDGCLVRRLNKTKGEAYTHHTQFKLSKERKITALVKLLDSMGAIYTLAKCKKSGINKLQPYYIRIYGEWNKKIVKLLDDTKQIPKIFANLSKSQLTVFLDELRLTDGHARSDTLTQWNTTSLHDVEIIQLACITNGKLCYFNEKEGASGFKNGKIQYRVNIGALLVGGTDVKMVGENGNIVSIQTINQTLITRRNGKVSFTGNCRLLRHLADNTPALKAVLSALHGFTVAKLLGLDDFQINYIAKSDLAAYSKADLNRELGKNYKIYYDCFVAHHFPHAKNMGIPGVNGHHHRHEVWSMFNPIYGAYEWHQMGSGHKRSASYCEGERWHNGFAIVNIDTQTRGVNFDYVVVTDFSVSGGKWYHREPVEICTPNSLIMQAQHQSRMTK